MPTIMPLIIIFALSLGGAFVLFKYMKSTAEINSQVLKKLGNMNLDLGIRGKLKNRPMKITGAVAGFVIIFGLLTNSYYYLRVDELEKRWKPQPWTVTGYLVKEGSTSFEGVNVSYQPPAPAFQIRQPDGNFNLYRVMLCDGMMSPTLQFYCDGFLPDYYKLSPEKIVIDRDSRVITLKNKIVLGRIGQAGGVQ
jgi:hypothetical protein